MRRAPAVWLVPVAAAGAAVPALTRRPPTRTRPRTARGRPCPCRPGPRTRAGPGRPSGSRRAGTLEARQELRQRRDRVGGLERGQDPLGPGHRPHRGDGLAVGGRRHLEPAGLGEGRELRPDARVVEAGRRGVRLDDLAVRVLEHERAGPVEDARACRRRSPPHGGPVSMPSPAASATARRTRRLADEPREQPDGVRSAADAGEGDVRQPTLDVAQLGARPRRRSAAGGRARSSGTGAGPSRSPRT